VTHRYQEKAVWDCLICADRERTFFALLRDTRYAQQIRKKKLTFEKT